MRRVLGSLCQVAAVWALAVTQPLLGPLGRSPEYFVAQRFDRTDLLLFVSALTLAPLAACGGVLTLAAAAGATVLDWATAVLIGAAAGVLGAVISYRQGVSDWAAAILVALIVAVVVGAASRRASGRLSFTVLTPAVFVVPALFVFQLRPLFGGDGHPARPASGSPSTPVVLVVFDELSLVSLLDGDGNLDAVRYPRIVGVAKDGVWYRRATTVSDFTEWAVPAILTAKYPRPGTTPDAGSHPDSIFTLFAPHYGLHVTEPLTDVCPQTLCPPDGWSRLDRLRDTFADLRIVASYVFLPPSARVGLPSLADGWAGFGRGAPSGGLPVATKSEQGLGPAHAWLQQVRDFVADIAPSGGRPSLYFLHTPVSHRPARWLPSGQVIADRVELTPLGGDGRWPDEPWAVIEHYQGALLQAQLADTIVGWLVDRLKERGLYERTLIVLTADHGASYRSGDARRMLTETNAGDIVPVPLIVKWPAGQQAPRGLDDRNVQTIDILPTIADAVGLTLPIDVDGVSALGRGRVDDGKRVYFSQATKVRYFSSDETWHLVLEAARRQRAIFGADRWPSPRLAGFEHLVGQPIEGLTVEGEAGIRPKIARPLAFENIDPTSPTLPVQVVGTIEPPSRPPPGALGVAVAINGTIAATSQTRPGSGQWFALVPPSALRPGPNAVSVYLLDPAHPDWLLAPRTPDGPRVSNLMLPEATAWGVRQEGLYRLEGDASHPFRWTDGKASIDVPIDPAHQPTELSIAAAVTGSSVGRLRVLVDGCEALTTEAPDGWSERVALGRCAPPGYWAHVEILSGTHVTGHGDRRELGIALSRLTLD